MRQLREQQARALGFADLATYYDERYVRQGARVEDLMEELGVYFGAVVADMDRCGISRRPAAERSALARSVKEAKRAEEHETLCGRARELGFATLEEYLRDRYERCDWRIPDVAMELASNASRVRKLLARYGIATKRTSLPADPAERSRRLQQRLAAPQAALAAKRRREDEELAERLGFATVNARYADRLGRGWGQRAMLEAAGRGRKGLRRVASTQP